MKHEKTADVEISNINLDMLNLKKTCQEIINKNKDVLTIIIGGSRARGDYKESSDFDLMFITKKGKNTDIALKYEKIILNKTGINYSLVQVKLWTNKFFKQRYEKGDSFIYCALRDGKILATRQKKIERKLPDCRLAAKERIGIAENRLQFIKWRLEDCKTKRFSGLDAEHLGLCAMHFCWAACMLENFCPVSKYTALKESKKYFYAKEFKAIKKAYSFYSHPQIERQFNRENIEKLHAQLSKIIEQLKRAD